MLKFYLCVRSVILGFIKILTELFVQLFLKRRGKTIPRKNYLHHWVFFQSRKICEFRAVTIEILLYLPDTSRFYLTRGICNVEMFRLLQNTVVIHIAYSFILWRLFFLLLFCLKILQAHDKEQEWKQLPWKLSLSSNFLFLFWRNMN